MADHRKLLWDTIYELHLDRLKKVKPIIMRYKLGKITESQARAYFRWLGDDIEKGKLFPNVLEPPPEAEQLYADGLFDVDLGVTENGLRMGTRVDGSPTHKLIAGATGTGKTSLTRRLFVGIHDYCLRTGRQVSMTIIDPKADFSDMPRLAPGKWLVMDASTTLRMSMKPPRGVSDDAFIMAVASWFAARFGVISARVGISKVIRWLALEMNRGRSSFELYPSWQLVAEVIKESPPGIWFSKGEYEKSAETALSDIVDGSGQLFECFSGFDFYRAASEGTNVVVNLDSVTHPGVRGFLHDMIVGHFYYGPLADHHKTDRTERVLCVDESDEFVSRKQEELYPLSLSPVGRLLKQGREFGTSVVLSSTLLDSISPYVISNMTEIYAYNQANEASLSTASRALLLPHGGGERMLGGQRPGRCLVRQALSAFPWTMLVEVDYVPPDRSGRPPFDTHPYVPAQQLKDMPGVFAALRALTQSHERVYFGRRKKVLAELPENARKLLDLASLYPYEPVNRLWSRAGSPSPSVQSAARKALEKRKYARFCETRQGRSNLLLMEITEAGYEFLGKPAPGVPGAGGAEHRHYSEWICRSGRKHGYRAETEQQVPDGSGRTDVLWWRDGECHAFEVVVECSENLCAHLRSCLVESGAVNTVTVVAAQKSLLDKLRELVAADESLESVRARIEFQLIEPYLKELWP